MHIEYKYPEMRRGHQIPRAGVTGHPKFQVTPVGAERRTPPVQEQQHTLLTSGPLLRPLVSFFLLSTPQQSPQHTTPVKKRY